MFIGVRIGRNRPAEVYPEAGRRQRPLGIAALEDKIVQRAVVEVLNAIYEEDFLGFSYGFRPDVASMMRWMRWWSGSSTKVNWILDADIRSFFDTVSHAWLVRFWSTGSATAHHPPDPQMAEGGCTRRGDVTGSEGKGAGDGDLATAGEHLPALRLRSLGGPLAATRCHGDMIVVRYADDIVVGFEHEADAQRFLAEMRERSGSVRSDAAPGEDTPDRVRPLCGVRQRSAEGQAGDLQLSGLHNDLRKSRRGKFQLNGNPGAIGCRRSSWR